MPGAEDGAGAPRAEDGGAGEGAGELALCGDRVSVGEMGKAWR